MQLLCTTLIEMHPVHEQTTTDLVYALRTENTCISVHPFDL